MRVNKQCVEMIENYPGTLENLYHRSGISPYAASAMRERSAKTKLSTIKKLATFFRVDWHELTDELYDERSVPVDGDKLYNRMIELDLDYKKIAKRIGRGKGTVYQIINGSNTTKATLEKLGKVLGMTVDEMRVEEK